MTQITAQFKESKGKVKTEDVLKTKVFGESNKRELSIKYIEKGLGFIFPRDEGGMVQLNAFHYESYKEWDGFDYGIINIEKIGKFARKMGGKFFEEKYSSYVLESDKVRCESIKVNYFKGDDDGYYGRIETKIWLLKYLITFVESHIFDSDMDVNKKGKRWSYDCHSHCGGYIQRKENGKWVLDQHFRQY